MDDAPEDAETKKAKIMQMLMPPLKSPTTLQPKASRKTIMSRKRIMRGKWGIKLTGKKKDKVDPRTSPTGIMKVPKGVGTNIEWTKVDEPDLKVGSEIEMSEEALAVIRKWESMGSEIEMSEEAWALKRKWEKEWRDKN